MYTDEKPLHIKALAQKALKTTTVQHSNRLERLTKRVSQLHCFVYGCTNVLDDEILNWTFVDVCDDLNAALWNLACGFYKPAGTLLRCALDLGVASLYFQIQEEIRPRSGGYNEEFAKWDSGNADTPRWKTMLKEIKNSPCVKRFDVQYGCILTGELYDHFRYLCSFTHSRPFADRDQSPTTNINMGINQPEFDGPSFERFCSLFESTVGWIATLWLVTYPTILKAKPLGDVNGLRTEYLALLSISRAGDALDFALNEVASGH